VAPGRADAAGAASGDSVERAPGVASNCQLDAMVVGPRGAGSPQAIHRVWMSKLGFPGPFRGSIRVSRPLGSHGSLSEMSRLTLGLVTTLALSASAALAQPAAPAAPATSPAAPAPAAPAAAPVASPAAPPAPPPGPTPKKGMLGEGVFWAAIDKGDAAYAARDFDGALKDYREAIEKEPQNPMGHYRVGSVQLAKGDLAEAEQSWQAGLRFAGKDPKLRAKLLFVLADLRERQRNHDDAIARWKEYAQHVQAQPDAKGFPATAVEREKRVTEWKQLQADSLVVKERIDKRLKETEESMRKSSK
jgi:TolA-binding protein